MEPAREGQALSPSSDKVCNLLTRIDGELMEDFEATFPELAGSDESIRKIDEDALKSTVGKKKWREFILRYEQKSA